MPVQENCSFNSLIVSLNITAGQRLRYTVREDSGVQFQLRDETGRILLPSPTDPDARVRLWPETPAEKPASIDVSHGFGATFGGIGQARWIIELLAPDGAVLMTVKDCVYANDENTPNPYFDTIRIRSS